MLATRQQPRRQDTLELRETSSHDHDYDQDLQQQEYHDNHSQQSHQQYENRYASDEEHSVLEDDSGDEQYMDDEDDNSSSLSIPSESIDFDLVYSIQTFVATVEGQANVVKGDSLFLMDDSNSYWWLVRVLKTQEVGYIPAENIETPFERLARLNKHRNVDLAAATQAERQEDLRAARERMRAAMARSTSPHVPVNKGIIISSSVTIHTYPRFLWGNDGEAEEDSEEDGYESYEDNDMDDGGPDGMDPDDDMSWEDGAAEQAQARLKSTSSTLNTEVVTPKSLRPGPGAAPPQVQSARTAPAATAAPTSQQAQLGLGAAPSVRSQSSRDKLVGNQQDSQQSQGRVYVDPAEATGTRQISVTPDVARGSDSGSTSKRSTSPGTVAPGRSSSQQGLQRTISGDSSTSLASKSSDVKAKGSMDNSSINSKQRKSGRATPDDADESGVEGGKEKKKKSGMFSGLFSSKKKDKKEKDVKKGGISPGGADGDSISRASEDSGASASNSPAEPTQAAFAGRRPQVNSTDPRRSMGGKENQVAQTQEQRELSSHASRMQQKDLQEQALYQQYLNRSPSSPPDASLSYGLQTAASQGHQLPAQSLTPNRPFNNRPGSLIITGNALDGTMVPELSVMRMFAGERLQSEATFKTVLLNTSTTAADLVRQAMQRFRLPHGEDESHYYLTVVKQFEGDEMRLEQDEHPLEIFEELVQSAMEIPTVKRSSISSINSNLSIQPAITKLAMNDFTDDSAVKFYLNRRPSTEMEYPENGDADKSGVTSTRSLDGNSTSKEDDSILSTSTATDPVAMALRKLSNTAPNGRPQLSLNVQGVVAPERFSSPTTRFALQVAIYPDDLPEGMIFDPATEAIIPRASLQARSQTGSMANPGVSQTQRKKVFVFPKNTTVAEVIEQSLDMFGIQDGVVDGGDEIEDKMSKRRSSARVRYGLSIQLPDQTERELNPSTKILDAFVRPPAFKANNRRSADMRRRSMDSSQILGSIDDVQAGDPTFILRRAVSYRTSSTSKNRMSAPLDDVALRHLQRDSVMSEQSMGSEYTSATESPVSTRRGPQISQRDVIAAQREASRLNQRTLLMTAQANSQRGVDLLLPDKGRLRSMRSAADERMRYSYIQPDGETYDISDIIEEELWDVGQDRQTDSRNGRPGIDEDDTITPSTMARGKSHHNTNGDLLEDVLVKPRDVMEQRIDQVLAKIKSGARASVHAPSDIDVDRASDTSSPANENRRSPTPRTGSSLGRHQASHIQSSGSRTHTPVNYQRGVSPREGSHSKQHSVASTMMSSDFNATELSTPGMKSITTDRTTPATRPPIILKDDFGFSKMVAVIEAGAALKKPPPSPALHEIDELLFGPNISVDDLHPAAREIFSPMFEHLADVNQQLDLLLQNVFRT